MKNAIDPHNRTFAAAMQAGASPDFHGSRGQTVGWMSCKMLQLSEDVPGAFGQARFAEADFIADWLCNGIRLA